jgi:hypothetical protein
MLTYFTVLFPKNSTKSTWLKTIRYLSSKNENNNTAPIQDSTLPETHISLESHTNKATGEIVKPTFLSERSLPIGFRKDYVRYIPLLKQKSPTSIVTLLATLKFPKNNNLKFVQKEIATTFRGITQAYILGYLRDYYPYHYAAYRFLHLTGTETSQAISRQFNDIFTDLID